MNRREANSILHEEKASETPRRNPFKNSIRGNIKNNTQIDSFVQSQEVYELLQNTLGSPKSQNLSQSFRIPLKHTTPRESSRTHSKFRDRNEGPYSKNDRHSFTNQHNSRQPTKGDNKRNSSANELYSRRTRNDTFSQNISRNDPHTSTFGKRPRERSPSWDSYKNLESQNADKKFICERNTDWRDNESLEMRNQFSSNRSSEEKQLHFAQSFMRDCFQYKSEDRQTSSNSYSNSWIKQGERPSTAERNTDNPFSKAPNPMESERCTSRERFPNDEHTSSCFINDHRRHEKLRSSDRGSSERIPHENKCQKVDSLARINPPRQSGSRERVEIDRGALATEKQLVKQRQAMKKLKTDAKKFRLGKPCKVEIKDKSHPNGKISEPHARSLMNSIEHLLKENIFKGSKYPRYLGHIYENELCIVVCADFFAGEFLRSKVPKLPPPWEGATLECRYVTHFECIVDVNLPKSISHVTEFYSLCQESNSALNTKAWRFIGYEDSEEDNRRLYTIGMDTESYNTIKNEFNGLVRCGDEDIKFVLSLKKSDDAT